MKIAGAIIAGGRGSRMGTPHKAAIRLGDGSTSSERLATALHGAGCSPVVIVSNEASPYVGLGLATVADRRPGIGPLAGIESALLAVAPLPVCVVAGDMPRLGVEHLQRLLAAWDGRLAVAWTDRMQPLCAVVAAHLVKEVSAAIDRGEHGVYRLWECLGSVPVHFTDQAAFVDLDTPEDLARCQ
jgi:molybdopterin-guanine dinucleotide biosynthesis protein A